MWTKSISDLVCILPIHQHDWEGGASYTKHHNYSCEILSRQLTEVLVHTVDIFHLEYFLIYTP